VSQGLNKKELSTEDLKTIELLLSQSSHNPPELEDMWQLMDKVWDEIGCNNKDLVWEKIDKFYHHPVWILNGLFIEKHDLSLQHRNAISDWIVKKKLKKVLDYGGGFGTLAQLIVEKDPTISIDIYEPYPSNYAISRISDYNNIQFVDSMNNFYDCVVSIDVLEHVSDPLKIFSKQIESVRKDGFLIIANNFYPVIKCHLPSTFHLRYTFNKFTQLMGLELVGPCEGSHAIIYRKRETIPINWHRIRMYEKVSKMLFPFLNILHIIYLRLKKII
jgi:2-polyprenyl-3-methyl-5-hydroxy-6-metoxy-1,4-benzoquinol methylase